MFKSQQTTLSLIALIALGACGKAPESIAPSLTPQPQAPQVAAAPAPVSEPQPVAPPAGTTPLVASTAAPAPLVFPAPTAAAKPAANTRVANFAGLETDIPVSWTPVPPANSMRLAEFQAPSAGLPAAEAVVFFFPPGQGGPQDMNIARWASQFTDAKGAPVKPQIGNAVINNMAVTRIELNGNYSRGVGMGTTEGAVKPNQTLLAAIITTPAGNVTMHFFGPQASVKKQRESFEAVLRSIRFKG